MKKVIRIALMVLVLAALCITECPTCNHIIHTKDCGIEEVYAEEQEEEQFAPWDIPLDEDLQTYIHDLCEEYNMSYALIVALIDTESDFDTDAVSTTGDYGLMQINEINHKDGYDYTNAYDNVKHGIKALHKLCVKYEEAELALMAYNMGEAGAAAAWNKGVYSTEYTRNIMEIKCSYERSNYDNL